MFYLGLPINFNCLWFTCSWSNLPLKFFVQLEFKNNNFNCHTIICNVPFS